MFLIEDPLQTSVMAFPYLSLQETDDGIADKTNERDEEANDNDNSYTQDAEIQLTSSGADFLRLAHIAFLFCFGVSDIGAFGKMLRPRSEFEGDGLEFGETCFEPAVYFDLPLVAW